MKTLNTLLVCLRIKVLSEILLISGFDRSGKSTVSNALEKQGFYIFECGAVVKKMINSNEKIEISTFYEKNMKYFNLQIHNEILNISAFHKKLAIIGVRSINLYSLLKENFPTLNTIFIDSKNEVRYRRFVQNDGPSTIPFNLFLKNDSMQVNWGLDQIKSLSNLIIVNDDDYLNFSEKIEKMVKSL